MVRAVQAKDFLHKSVYLLGNSTAVWNRQISSMQDLTVTSASQSGRLAYEMAKVGPKDIDVVELYDAFTINTILFLEDLGFCAKGDRKSTRLNSSHVAISYAVFCLKKKNSHENIDSIIAISYS